MKKHKRHWFTLVEMLIVIVIIGILAAALIPRLLSARGRANDTARKADLQQLGTALISYQIDNSSFPATAGSIDTIKTELTRWGLGSIPTDPNRNNVFSGIVATTGTAGQYMFTPIQKNGAPGGGFVLMASTETENGSNYLYCSGVASTLISTTTDFDNIFLCSTFTTSTTSCIPANSGSTACTYTKWWGNLRYIYRY